MPGLMAAATTAPEAFDRACKHQGGRPEDSGEVLSFRHFCLSLGMLRPIADVAWAHIGDLLGTGPRPNVVGWVHGCGLPGKWTLADELSRLDCAFEGWQPSLVARRMQLAPNPKP